MLTKFDEQAQKAIVVGESIAFDLGHNNVGSEHLLLSLLKIFASFSMLFRHFRRNFQALKAQLFNVLAGQKFT